MNAPCGVTVLLRHAGSGGMAARCRLRQPKRIQQRGIELGSRWWWPRQAKSHDVVIAPQRPSEALLLACTPNRAKPGQPRRLIKLPGRAEFPHHNLGLVLPCPCRRAADGLIHPLTIPAEGTEIPHQL